MKFFEIILFNYLQYNLMLKKINISIKKIDFIKSAWDEFEF